MLDDRAALRSIEEKLIPNANSDMTIASLKMARQEPDEDLQTCTHQNLVVEGLPGQRCRPGRRPEREGAGELSGL